MTTFPTPTVTHEVVISIKPAPIEAVSHPDWPEMCRKAIALYKTSPIILEALKFSLSVLAAGPVASDEDRKKAMTMACEAIVEAGKG